MNAKDIDVSVLGAYYKELNGLVGTDSMIKIFRYYRGSQITIPVHLYDRELVSKKVVNLYNGHNAKQLAIKYGYTEKWVNKILSKKNKK